MAAATSPKYDVLYDLTRRQLDTLFSFTDSVETKTGGVFAISTALLGVVAGVLALRPAQFHDSAVQGLAAGISICFLLSLFASVRLLRIPSWGIGPELEPGKYARFLRNENDAKREAAAAFLKAYKFNYNPYERVVRRFRIASVALLAQTALTVFLSLRVAGVL
jgi:hypothetical protein